MEKKGYRCDYLFGSGVLDVKDIIAYEIFELCNTDILDTLAEGLLKNSTLEETLKRLSEIISQDIEDTEFDEFINKAYEDYKFSYGFVQDLLDEIKNVTGKDIKYAVWLCDTKEDVQRYAINEKIPEEDIDEYNISSVILSDIGKDGKLYGYESTEEIIKKL
mgnify:CR=1 FL=1